MSTPNPTEPTRTPDRILIQDLAFSGPHGWFEHERLSGCRFMVDVRLTLDTRPAARSDRLRDTVDYGAVSECLLAVGTGPSVHLLERLAERLVEALLVNFPAVDSVALTLRKLAPPIPGGPAAVGIQIERHREPSP